MSGEMDEKQWCPACGKWGDHGSGSCPEITSPVNDLKGLRCCPYCGGEATVYSNLKTENQIYYSVKCLEIMQCGARMEYWDTFGAAVDAWNRRAPQTTEKAPEASNDCNSQSSGSNLGIDGREG